MRFQVGLLILTGAAGVVPSPASAAPRLTITPREALVDASVMIRLEGVPANREITLRASAVDAEGRTWRSEAVFQSSRKGVVDVTWDPAVRGSYTGIDGMGLFWSMKVDPATATLPAAVSAPPRPARSGMQDLLAPPEGTRFPLAPSGTLHVPIDALDGSRPIGTNVAIRRLTGEEMKVKEVREEGLVGRLYEPPGTRNPAVLVLGGSTGGIEPAYAPVLAGHGYVTFALAYFREEGLPKDLVEVPLESLRSGLEWLRSQPSVDPERVAVLGLSRGAELALLLGAHHPEVKAVVALAPSSVVWEGAVRDPGKRGLDAIKIDRSAWTVEGRALAFVPKRVTPEVAAKIAAGERVAAIDFIGTEALAAAPEGAHIPVERIRGAILLVSSRADRMWPAAEMGDQVVQRLKANGFQPKVEHLSYDDTTHPLPDAWLPPSYGGTLGGSAAGTMRAYRDYWPRVIAFLGESLAPRP